MRPVDPALIRDTLEELDADLDIAAVHIGMLGSAKVVKAVADFLEAAEKSANTPVQTPPSASPEYRLGSDSEVIFGRRHCSILQVSRLLIERLVPLADVITPNTDEASGLTGLRVNELDDDEGSRRQTASDGSLGCRDYRRRSGEGD